MLNAAYFALYAVFVATKDDADVLPSVVLMDVVLVALLLLLTVLLIVNHPHLFMLKQLSLQFRANLLVVSLVMSASMLALNVSWELDASVSRATFELVNCKCANQLVIEVNVLLLYLRDGMDVSYPRCFVVLEAASLFVVSGYSILLLTFGRWYVEYPRWYSMVGKEAYSQIMLICFLSIYYLCNDPDNRFFVLIRKRKETNQLWGDGLSGATVNV